MIAFLMTIEDEETRNILEEIYKLHKKKMYYTARDILHDDYEAEDAMQEALIKVSKYIDKNMDPKCNKTLGLIVIIVRSISINIYNKRKRRKTIDIDGYENVIHDDTIGNPQLNIIRLDQKQYITKKLSQIKKEYADILTLKYYYGYSNKEISDLLSIKEGNVRVRLMRAKNALHEIIGDESHEK